MQMGYLRSNINKFPNNLNNSHAQLYLNILMARCIGIHKPSKYDDIIDASELFALKYG